jgi:hypothetical protein
MWNLNIPVTRATFDGTTATSASSREAAHEAVIRSMHDNCNAASGSRRSYRDKSNALSTPTGIGRQVSDAEARAGGATGAGFQHLIAANAQGWACTWHDGNASAGPRQKWAGYSWNSWYKLFEVTDLCQALLWEGDPDDAEGSHEASDMFDGNGDGRLDERTGSSPVYLWSSGGRLQAAAPVEGNFPGELRQVNKLNLNEVCSPAVLASAGWTQSYTSIGRKPLKGFHSPSGFLTRNYSFAGTDAPYDLNTSDPG